jgi:hypothetical protein
MDWIDELLNVFFWNMFVCVTVEDNTGKRWIIMPLHNTQQKRNTWGLCCGWRVDVANQLTTFESFGFPKKVCHWLVWCSTLRRKPNCEQKVIVLVTYEISMKMNIPASQYFCLFVCLFVSFLFVFRDFGCLARMNVAGTTSHTSYRFVY